MDPVDFACAVDELWQVISVASRPLKNMWNNTVTQ